MTLLDKIKKLIWNKDSILDNWLNKKFNAYGWRGFVASLLWLGSLYIIMYYSPEIAMFFGGDKHTLGQELTYQARMFVVNKVAIVILVLMVVKLIKQYASKEEREAHQEKMRKDALMEAEIKERQKNNAKPPPSTN
jgi:uncharacterized membrane protein